MAIDQITIVANERRDLMIKSQKLKNKIEQLKEKRKNIESRKSQDEIN